MSKNRIRIVASLASGVLASTLLAQSNDYCLFLDGENDFVEFLSVPSLTSFTIEAWAKVDREPASGLNCILSFTSAVAPNNCINGFTIDRLSTGNTQLVVTPTSCNNGATPGGSASAHAWHHYAGVYDGAKCYFYIDGNLVNTGGTATTFDAGTRGLIGARTNDIGGTNPPYLSNFFRGYIDEVRLWNVVRSATDIANNMNVKLDPTTQTGLVGYWNFDEGTGQTITNSASPGTYNGRLGASTSDGRDDPIFVLSDAPPADQSWKWIPCYANCDGSTLVPVLSANDFNCYLAKFRAGCP
jgi:hypothetical protein